MNVDAPQVPMLGPALIGGGGYRVSELAALPERTAHATGLGGLDDVLGGGLGAGEVLTVAGPASVGVSRLVVQVAVSMARTGRVLVVNGHVPTRRLVHALTKMGRHFDLNAGDMDRLEVASWMPLPDADTCDARWFGADYDAVVIDCLDEMFRPQAWPDTENVLRHGRWLRECAQRSSTALVVTARADSPADVGAASFDRAWRAHRVRRAFTDIADASCEMFLDAQPDTVIRMAARGGERLVQRSRLDHDSLIRLIIRS